MSDNNQTIKFHKEDIISRKSTNISKEYTLGKTIGKGAYGQVRLAIHKATKNTCRQNNSQIQDRFTCLNERGKYFIKTISP